MQHEVLVALSLFHRYEILNLMTKISYTYFLSVGMLIPFFKLRSSLLFSQKVSTNLFFEIFNMINHFTEAFINLVISLPLHKEKN